MLTRRSRCAVCAPALIAASGLSRRAVPRNRGPLEVSDVTLSWLATTSNDGAAIMAYVIERLEHLSPTWTRVVRVRPQTTTRSTRSATQPTTISASARRTSREPDRRGHSPRPHSFFAPCLQ